MSDIQVTKDAITLWFEATDAGIEFSYHGTSIYNSHKKPRFTRRLHSFKNPGCAYIFRCGGHKKEI